LRGRKATGWAVEGGGNGRAVILVHGAWFRVQFVPRYVCTIGVDYGVKPVTVGGEAMRVNFWDVSGHPSFAEVRTEFYRDTEGAMLVFDVGDRDSFTGLEAWLAEMRAHGLPAEAFLVLVGNKSDRARREVSTDEARAWALDHRIEFVSAF
jgi:DnaJ homolog subfamily C member 27